MDKMRNAKFKIGQVVKHRVFIRCRKQLKQYITQVVSDITVRRSSPQ